MSALSTTYLLPVIDVKGLERIKHAHSSFPFHLLLASVCIIYSMQCTTEIFLPMIHLKGSLAGVSFHFEAVGSALLRSAIAKPLPLFLNTVEFASQVSRDFLHFCSRKDTAP
ncbi:hypothetical protein V6N12_001578 [Hibiscus sabdariffa]|uniref:Uncharacterized protein n=1 Tax=Hibiscus sabdariffa TaxID=183260 RepID=A0ABR2A269_9ROSI